MTFGDWCVLLGPFMFAIFFVLGMIFLRLTFIQDSLEDIARAIRERKS